MKNETSKLQLLVFKEDAGYKCSNQLQIHVRAMLLSKRWLEINYV